MQNDLGQFEMHVDFRSNPEDFDYETRPEVTPGQLYTDSNFPLDVAMGNEHKRKPLEWKRPPVSIEYNYDVSREWLIGRNRRCFGIVEATF